MTTNSSCPTYDGHLFKTHICQKNRYDVFENTMNQRRSKSQPPCQDRLDHASSKRQRPNVSGRFPNSNDLVYKIMSFLDLTTHFLMRRTCRRIARFEYKTACFPPVILLHDDEGGMWRPLRTCPLCQGAIRLSAHNKQLRFGLLHQHNEGFPELPTARLDHVHGSQIDDVDFEHLMELGLLLDHQAPDRIFIPNFPCKLRKLRLEIDGLDVKTLDSVCNTIPSSVQHLTIDTKLNGIDDIERFLTLRKLKTKALVSMNLRLSLVTHELAEALRTIPCARLNIDMGSTDELDINAYEQLENLSKVPCQELFIVGKSNRDKKEDLDVFSKRSVQVYDGWTDESIRVLTTELPLIETFVDFGPCLQPILFSPHQTCLREFRAPGHVMTAKGLASLPTSLVTLCVSIGHGVQTQSLSRLRQLCELQLLTEEFDGQHVALCHLHKLTLVGRPHIHVDGLEYLPTSIVELYILGLKNQTKPSIDLLSRLVKLKKLILEKCEMNLDHLASLKNLRKLTHLDLDGTVTTLESFLHSLDVKKDFPFLNCLVLNDVRRQRFEKFCSDSDIDLNIRSVSIT